MSRVLDLLTPAHGQCRLSFVSATSLRLSPYGGQLLSINGLPCLIPSAGVTIGNGGLANSTTYFVYAFMSGTSMTLELSTTGHSTHTNGVEIKTGDATRTLVGMARTTAAGQFVDDAASLFLLSWFNRRRKIGRARFTTNRTSVGDPAPYAEVHPEIRVNFLTWADESVSQAISGGWTVTGGGTVHGYCVIDADNAGLRQWCSHSATSTGAFSSVDERLVSEGHHYGTLFGKNNGGTNALFLGGQNGEITQVLSVMG
jgi:hypothetical protein